MKLDTNVCVVLLQYVLNRTKNGEALTTDFITIANELRIPETVIMYHLDQLTKGCFTMNTSTKNEVTLYDNTQLAKLLLDTLNFVHQRLAMDAADLASMDYRA